MQRWLLPVLGAGVFALAPVRATANGDAVSYGGYRAYEPDFEAAELGRAYFIDPVNRRSSLTPEPVWRSMFPGISSRIRNEERVFGRRAQADRELRYWRRIR